jgi:oligopeptide transport system substrate-binding protein
MNRIWHRKQGWLFSLVSLLAVVALVGAACGDDDDDDDAATAEEPEPAGDDAEATEPPAEDDDDVQAADNRQDGGELVVHGNEFASLDPHFSSFAQDISLHRMLWRGLYSLDIDNQLVFDANGIAAGEPEISEDGLMVTVTLNAGLTWSDGDDLTAEDYVAGIIRTCNPVNAGQYQYVLVNIVGCDEFYTADPAVDDLPALQDAVGVTAVDDLTIQFSLIEPQPTFPILLALWMTFPVPAHLDRFATATAEAPGDWGTDPAGLVYNGPYMLTSYTQQDNATLEPNPNWSGLIKPTLDQLTIRFIDDNSVANNAYRNDELQYSFVDTAQLATIPDEFGDEYVKFLLPSTRGLQIQLANETLADLDVRLALAKAIDRETMVEVVVQGANEPTTSWIPEVTSGVPIGTFDEVIGFDPEAAQQHLADAGFPGGEGFPTLTILVGDTPAARATAEFLQQNFADILGITVEIEVVDAATRSTRFTEEQFDLFPGGWIQDYPDPENWILGQYDTEGTLNHYNCSNPDIDALVEQARFNTNNEERIEQYREIEALIVENVCGIAPYWHENNHHLVKPEVCGMKENVSGQDAFQAGDWIAEAWGLCA